MSSLRCYRLTIATFGVVAIVFRCIDIARKLQSQTYSCKYQDYDSDNCIDLDHNDPLLSDMSSVREIPIPFSQKGQPPPYR